MAKTVFSRNALLSVRVAARELQQPTPSRAPPVVIPQDIPGASRSPRRRRPDAALTAERSAYGRLGSPEASPGFTYPALGQTGHRAGHWPTHLKRLAVRLLSATLPAA